VRKPSKESTRGRVDREGPNHLSANVDPSLSHNGSRSSRLSVEGDKHKKAFEDLAFVYRRNVLYWRATLFKHRLREFDRDSLNLHESAKRISHDLDQYCEYTRGEQVQIESLPFREKIVFSILITFSKPIPWRCIDRSGRTQVIFMTVSMSDRWDPR
jgi:hypothetical protein